jgi:hypothetical protein
MPFGKDCNMLDIDFAKRLLGWGDAGLLAGLVLLFTGAMLAYVLDDGLSTGVQALGHLMVGIGGLGLKSGYVMRLAALDVLEPHAEGWRSLWPGNAG